jgi:hypothetical protein
MACQYQPSLTLSAFACVPAASSCNSFVGVAAVALKFFDCMQVVSCAGAAQGYAIGAKASQQFAEPSIGLSD